MPRSTDRKRRPSRPSALVVVNDAYDRVRDDLVEAILSKPASEKLAESEGTLVEAVEGAKSSVVDRALARLRGRLRIVNGLDIE